MQLTPFGFSLKDRPFWMQQILFYNVLQKLFYKINFDKSY